MLDISHKTIFVLDHSVQMSESSGYPLDPDLGTLRSSRQPGANEAAYRHYPPISKSLWTCVVENTIEYSRILWDIFSEDRLVRVLLSNPQSTETATGWEKAQQNVPYMSEAFANAGPPLTNKGSVQNSIKCSISALSELSEFQQEFADKTKCSYKGSSRGRVICITSYDVDSDLEEYFSLALNRHNKAVAQSSNIALSVQECEFVLIVLCPKGKERAARVKSSKLHEVTSILKSEVCVITVDKIYDTLIDLCIRQHDLVRTVVTGIPMKEEQNASHSCNYDVRLLHPRLPISSKDTEYLKWSAPASQKGIGPLSNPCSRAVRITPMDVNSRPSTCLSNFVLNGRSVCLEMPKKGKLISHVLTSHGHEMWMHILETSRNVLEDPPSISEGIGGRVTDYRITDFVEFIKMHTLAPYREDRDLKEVVNKKSQRRASITQDVKPVDIAKAKLLRKTTYWPLTIGGSLLFALSAHTEYLMTHIPRDTLTEAEKSECNHKIFNLMTIEARGEAPPISSSHSKKGFKRDEQWKAVYNELEAFLRGNLHSEAHRQVLECFLTSRNADGIGNGKSDSNKDGPIDLALSGNGKSVSVVDSPSSPPPLKKLKIDESSSSAPKLNLLNLWKSKTEKPDINALPVVLKLYPNLRVEEKSDKSGGSNKDKRDRDRERDREDKTVNVK